MLTKEEQEELANIKEVIGYTTIQQNRKELIKIIDKNKLYAKLILNIYIDILVGLQQMSFSKIQNAISEPTVNTRFMLEKILFLELFKYSKRTQVIQLAKKTTVDKEIIEICKEKLKK